MWTPERIKELRKRYGESQPRFAERVGVCTGTIRCWEQGRGEPSSMAERMLDRLEQDLGVLAESREPAGAKS